MSLAFDIVHEVEQISPTCSFERSKSLRLSRLKTLVRLVSRQLEALSDRSRFV